MTMRRMPLIKNAQDVPNSSLLCPIPSLWIPGTGKVVWKFLIRLTAEMVIIFAGNVENCKVMPQSVVGFGLSGRKNVLPWILQDFLHGWIGKIYIYKVIFLKNWQKRFDTNRFSLVLLIYLFLFFWYFDKMTLIMVHFFQLNPPFSLFLTWILFDISNPPKIVYYYKK